MRVMSTQSRRLLGGACLLLIAFAILPRLRSILGSEAPHEGAHGSQTTRCDCLSAEETCRALIDDAFRVWKAGRREGRVWALNVCACLASTPAGHRHLRAMLADADPNRVAFAAYQISWGGADFADIAALRRCVERHRGDDKVVKSACETLSGLLDSDFRVTGVGNPYGVDRLEYLEWFARMCRWLDAHEPRWKGKTYAEYWGQQLAIVLKAQERSKTYQASEAASFCIHTLVVSTDAQRAAPLFVQCISERNPQEKDEVLVGLISALQLYIGPVDVPSEDNTFEQKKARQRILTWWERNKNKKPVNWMLDSLAARGYSTGNPADAKTTASGLISALKKGNPAERYAASRILAYVLPDGDGIPFPRDGILDPPEQGDAARVVPSTEYLNEVVLCRALRWALLEAPGYKWNPDAGRYEPIRARTDDRTSERPKQ